VIEEVFQTRQSLDPTAVAFLLGDIYAAVPMNIHSGDFAYIVGLFSRHHDASNLRAFQYSAPAALGFAAPFEGPAPAPRGFAAPRLSSPAIDATAFAAAGGAGTLSAPGWTTWVDGSIGHSAFAPTAEHLGLSFSTADTAIGADYADGPWRAGVSIAFAQTGFTQQDTGDSGAVTSVRGGAYAGFDGADWSIAGGVSAGYHWAQVERLSSLATPATASFSATSLSAAIEASRRFNLLGANVEPLAGATFSLVNTGGFNESGTTLLDLAGQPATTKALKVYIGGRASGRLALGNGIVVMPEAHVRITYDVLADPLIVTTAFINGASGAQTAISGPQPGRLAVQLGAGVGIEIARRWRVAIAYQAAFGGGSDLAHEFSGSIRGTW
jgi:outer membrane autotransporter protein